MRVLLPILLLPLLILAAACSTDGDASTASGVVTTTPVPSTPATQPIFARPPAATAGANGQTVPMGTGTYCWSAAGSNGVCVDAAGPVTGLIELAATAGAPVEITTAFPGSEIEDAVASAVPVNALQGNPAGPEQLVWNFPLAGGQQLNTTIHPAGVNFPAPTTPGRYVVSLFVRPNAGDVAYGVVLNVH
jgi:hypothetical protein